jgi:flagellar biosynthetic protein FlhB
MADSAANKSEQPTQKRLNKAREQGQVPQSVEFTSVITLVVMLTTVTLSAPHLMTWIMTEMKLGFSAHNEIFANTEAFVGFINSKLTGVLLVIAPILTALVVAGIAGNIIVSGLNFSAKAIQFKLSAINPVNGFGKLFDAKSFVKLIFSILKLIFVGLVVWFYLRDKLETLTALRWVWSTQILTAIAQLILGMMIRVCIALLIIAAADLAYQKWKYIQDLKMTKQEVKDERKETEGSPEIKNRIRKVQFQTALKRILQDVPKANVVLVNPTHYAVAIQYDAKTMDSPVLLAKGVDHMAEKIREVARAYGVPILRRPELARAIYNTMQPGQQIPQELYLAVAEVLALIYRLKHAKV